VYAIQGRQVFLLKKRMRHLQDTTMFTYRHKVKTQLLWCTQAYLTVRPSK